MALRRLWGDGNGEDDLLFFRVAVTTEDWEEGEIPLEFHVYAGSMEEALRIAREANPSRRVISVAEIPFSYVYVSDHTIIAPAD